MNKKTKIITRVIACILAFILILGLVVPVVYAEELDPLPDGFEWTEMDGSYVVTKSPDNKAPAITLTGYVDSFDTLAVTLFIGNLETKECSILSLNSTQQYVSSIDVPSGYYVIFGGNYGWTSADNKVYTLADYTYLYVGSSFDENKYEDVVFNNSDGIIGLPMTIAEDASVLQVVPYNELPEISNESIVFPTDAVPELKVNEDESTQPTTPVQPTPTTPATDVEGDDITFLDIIWSMIKDSAVLLIIIAGIYITLAVMNAKKKIALEKQAENDQYDDKRIE